MRLSLSLCLPALATLALAAKQSGHFFVLDSNTSPSYQAKSISPQAARLSISARTSLDRFHDVGSATEDDIEAINALAYKPVSHVQNPTAVIVAYGKDTYETAHNFEWNHKAEYALSPVPSQQETSNLVLDLALQGVWMSRLAGQAAEVSGIDEIKDALTKNGSMRFSFGQIETASTKEHLQALLHARTTAGYDALVLVMPHYTGLSSFSKSSKSHSSAYGSWSRPAMTTNTHNNKRDRFEEPLEIFPVTPNKATLEAAASSTSNSSIVRGILPSCFSTLASCQNMTNNCSGHGSCTLKYKDLDANGAACYTCICKADVRTNKDGTKKTTSWGGPACQKKDVVVPFWLLAGFSIFMVFLVSWGVGTIWSMGEEELPSVIGAGVSGVPKR